jgi:hypothetical protein
MIIADELPRDMADFHPRRLSRGELSKIRQKQGESTSYGLNVPESWV